MGEFRVGQYVEWCGKSRAASAACLFGEITDIQPPGAINPKECFILIATDKVASTAHIYPNKQYGDYEKNWRLAGSDQPMEDLSAYYDAITS